MQPQVKALLIASGLLVSTCSPLLLAADVVSGGQRAAADAAPGGRLVVVLPAHSGQFASTPDTTARDNPERSLPAVEAAPAASMAPASPAPTLMDLTTAPTSLWQRIRTGFGLPDMTSPLVSEQEEWFARRPDYIARTVQRSSRYLYYIVEQIEKRGMPSEIALLPIIESAYNPVAYSRAHASGIWQFIPSTGKHYGLQQNFWYDGRRDVMAATNAALDYLQKLYEMFGSWDLALASYNWGEGAVSRAIAKNMAKGLATDYRSLNMPAETRYYMPKLQAVKNIIANPAQFGIDLAEVANQPYFVAVSTTRHIDVKLAAKLADMPVDEFLSLNPGNSRPVIKADGERMLLFPADKAERFRSNLETHDEPLVSWQAYKLKSGETVDRIAARYGISATQLKQANGIGLKNGAGSGTTLLVPSGGSATPYLPDMPAPSVTVAKVPKQAGRHAAHSGSTTKTAHRATAGTGTRKGGGVATRKLAKGGSSKKFAAVAVKKTAAHPPARKIVLAQRGR